MAEFGTLSSLGIGSGVLSYDVIDKLKNADKKVMIKPLEEKLDLIKKKESALSQFITIGSTVKADILDLADGTLFSKVSTNVNGSSIEVKAEDGVKPQEFNINVKELAKNDIFESKGFASMDSIVNNSGDNVELSLEVGGVSTSFTLHAGASLNDLKEAINNANAGITASIIDTGIGDNPYRLVLKANETGKDNIIKFNYFNIEDLGLNATNYTSNSFASDTDVVNNSGSTQTFKIDVNGVEYSMDVEDGKSVSDFINDLNSGALKDSEGNSLKVDAKYEDGKIKFNIQAIGDITIDDTNLLTTFNDNTDFTNPNRLQTATNAKFTYNGVEIERASNVVDDLIVGVEINLKSVGESNVKISSNIDEMIEAIKKFVADYNQMISNLQNLIAYDKENETVGLFQGNSNFTMLSSRFSNAIFEVFESYRVEKLDRNGNKYTENVLLNATDVGFSLDRNGMISFDEEKFKSTYEKDPDLTNRLFERMFSNLKTEFDTTITGDHSNLNLLDESLKREEDSYQNRMDAMNKFLETKYEIMAKQFAAYDEMINSFNAQAKVIQQVIEQAIASKK